MFPLEVQICRCRSLSSIQNSSRPRNPLRLKPLLWEEGISSILVIFCISYKCSLWKNVKMSFKKGQTNAINKVFNCYFADQNFAEQLFLSIWTLVAPLSDPCWTLVKSMLDPFWTLVAPLSDPCWTLVGPFLDPCWTHVAPLLDPYLTRWIRRGIFHRSMHGLSWIMINFNVVTLFLVEAAVIVVLALVACAVLPQKIKFTPNLNITWYNMIKYNIIWYDMNRCLRSSLRR